MEAKVEWLAVDHYSGMPFALCFVQANPFNSAAVVAAVAGVARIAGL